MRRACLTSIAGLALLGASPAAAQLVSTGTGTATAYAATKDGLDHGTITINFDGNVNGTYVPGLTSQLVLTFLGVSSTQTWDFRYSLANTGSVDSRTSGFAFDTNPDVVNGSASGIFNSLLISGNYPNGVRTVDVCLLYANGNGNGCAGGASGGVDDGAVAGTGLISLTFASPQPQHIDLTDFFVRYQSIAGVQAGTSGTGSPVRSLPEPASWAMMLIGFAAIGASVRMSRVRARDRTVAG